MATAICGRWARQRAGGNSEVAVPILIKGRGQRVNDRAGNKDVVICELGFRIDLKVLVANVAPANQRQRVIRDQQLIVHTVVKPRGIGCEFQGPQQAALLDPDGKVGRLYEAKTTPQMILIGPTGTLLYDGAIDDRPTADQSSVKGAKNYIAAALGDALAGKPVGTPTSRPYGCSVKYR